MKTFCILITLLPFITSCTGDPGTLQAGVLAMAQTQNSGFTEEINAGVANGEPEYFKSNVSDTALLVNSHIRQIFQDKAGNSWYATYGNGVYRFDGQRLKHFSTREGLGGNIVRAITEDAGGNIWFATNGGVTRYTPHHSGSGVLPAGRPGFTRFTVTDGLNHNGVWSLLFDKSGNLWMGTENGVSLYDVTRPVGTDKKLFIDFPLPSKEQNSYASVYPAPKLVTALLQDKNGAIWFGTNGNGIYRLTTSELPASQNTSLNEAGAITNFTEADGLCNNFVQCLYEDNSGNLWIGSRFGGASRFNAFANKHTKEKLFTSLSETEGLGSNFVWDILEDQSGNMWFATGGGGLTKYKPSCNLTNCTSVPYTAVASQNNHAITVSLTSRQPAGIRQGCSPVNTYISGLTILPDAARFAVKSNDYIAYSEDDGLPNNFIQCLFEDNNGKLWIGTASGLSRYTGDENPGANGKLFVNYTKKEKGC